MKTALCGVSFISFDTSHSDCAILNTRQTLGHTIQDVSLYLALTKVK